MTAQTRIALRAGLGLVALLGVAACAPEIPDSGAGFTNQPPPAQSAPLGAPLPPPDAVSSEVLPPQAGVATATDPFAAPVPPTATDGSVAGASSSNLGYDPAATTGLPPTTFASGDDIAAETAAALAAAGGNSGQTPVQASPDNAPPVELNNPGISDENDFQAVASRESIASDAERLAQQRAQYEVVTPTAVPQRPAGASDPNIVEYALSTQHQRGTRVYSRSGINLASKAQKNCAQYASPDQAQIDFLAQGGPERDRMSLDPDGDGFACAWDPAPFRAAVN